MDNINFHEWRTRILIHQVKLFHQKDLNKSHLWWYFWFESRQAMTSDCQHTNDSWLCLNYHIYRVTLFWICFFQSDQLKVWLKYSSDFSYLRIYQLEKMSIAGNMTPLALILRALFKEIELMNLLIFEFSQELYFLF